MSIEPILKSFKQIVQNIYGERLAKVVLYGSYARGEATTQSDIDLIVVLKDDKISLIKELRAINKQVIDLILHHNIHISFLPVTEQKFTHYQSPLFFFVRKEGKEI